MPRLINVREVVRARGLQRLWPYVILYKQRIILGTVCAIVASLLMYLATSIFGQIADNLQSDHHDQALLNRLSLALLLVFVVRAGFSYGQAYCVNSGSQRILLRLRNEVYEHLQRMGLRFFDQRKTGQLMAPITADIPQVQVAVASGVDAVSAPVTVLVGVGAALWYNWRLALLSAVIIPLMATLITLATRRMRRASELMQTSLADISTLLEETLACIRVIRVQAALRPMIEVIGASGIVLAIWVGIEQIIQRAWTFAPPHYFTFGLLLKFVGTVHFISDAFRSLGGLSLNFQQANVAAERVFDLLDAAPDVHDRPGAVDLGPVSGSIEFRDVTFAYEEEPALRGVSFRVNPGEVLAIVGKSGAGKSTIANLIPRFYEVDRGAVLIDGVDVRDVTAKSLRRQIGIVPQESVLFGMSIRNNIAYSRPDATMEEIESAAVGANALEFIEALPDGFDTVVGQRGATLSGGQRQRVAIARAILSNPRVLLLDEATSSLDSQSEAIVQSALDRIMPGRTTVIIAHRLSTVRNADRILVLDGGRVVEEGRHEALLAANGAYAALYHRQMATRDVLSEPEAAEEPAATSGIV
ncbi:MAG: ABC transporter ATP-binding protein/permease [Chloroflexi bacterium]|nr:ABC transporter ATP-binding protein/permease [Chloroflexota bacterium]